MDQTISIFRREFSGYFLTPIAYVFIVIFLFMNGVFTFFMGDLFARGQADLEPFFTWHPWLYLFLIPALSMRLWAEERRSGTVELLMTLPVTVWQAVLAKYLAAWAFTGIALMLTFPVWITVNYLGNPDNGVVVAAYLGSFLMAGAYLAIGSCISSVTKNQVIAFVITAVVCFLFTVTGLPMITNLFAGWAPQIIVETVTSLSFVSNFQDLSRGAVDLRNLIYFVSLIVFWLFLNTVVLGHRDGA
ncbi:MAG: ABC transporter permease subunit [Pseudomonadota bacterium]|nr:ABC transporter permease subunit [Pseudomonadota bacterium]